MLGASARLRDSRIGWAWQAIREDELAARAMGINTTVAKLQAFAIGAAFAGIGGTFLASWQRSVFPDNFLFTESVNILAMVILGGMGNLVGVLMGATLLVAFPEIFRDFQVYRMLVFGLLLMVLMIFRPHGLLPVRSRREEESAAAVVAQERAGASHDGSASEASRSSVVSTPTTPTAAFFPGANQRCSSPSRRSSGTSRSTGCWCSGSC